MNSWEKKIGPLLEKFCPLFKHFCPVDFAHFQVQARKRSVLGWGCGVFCVCTFPRKGFVTALAEQGLVVVTGVLGKLRPHQGKMRPIWAICMKSGQKCSRIGQKKKIYHYEFKIMKSYMNLEYEFRYEFMIMKIILKSYVRLHMYEFIFDFMPVNS